LSQSLWFIEQWVGGKVLSAVVVTGTVFWEITPCSPFPCHLLCIGFLLGLLLNPEDGGELFSGLHGDVPQNIALFKKSVPVSRQVETCGQFSRIGNAMNSRKYILCIFLNYVFNAHRKANKYIRRIRLNVLKTVAGAYFRKALLAVLHASLASGFYLFWLQLIIAKTAPTSECSQSKRHVPYMFLNINRVKTIVI
jgi:hypothetical protein